MTAVSGVKHDGCRDNDAAFAGLEKPAFGPTLNFPTTFRLAKNARIIDCTLMIFLTWVSYRRAKYSSL